MKSRIAPLMIALLTCGALMAAGCQSAQEQAQPPAQKSDPREPAQSSAQKTERAPKIEIGEYGTLKRLNGSDGSKFPTNDKETLGDGYAIGYRFTDSKTGKQVEHFLYAVGDEKSAGLEIVPSEPTVPDANSVKRVVKTSDGALQITHEITWNETKRQVEIRRLIQGLSEKPVHVQVVRSQANNWLAGGDSSSSSAPRSGLKDLFRGLIRGGWSDCEFAQCPDPPCCCITWPICTTAVRGLYPPVVIARKLDDSKPETERHRTAVAEITRPNIGASDSSNNWQGRYLLTFCHSRKSKDNPYGDNLKDKEVSNTKSALTTFSYQM